MWARFLIFREAIYKYEMEEIYKEPFYFELNLDVLLWSLSFQLRNLKYKLRCTYVCKCVYIFIQHKYILFSVTPQVVSKFAFWIPLSPKSNQADRIKKWLVLELVRQWRWRRRMATHSSTLAWKIPWTAEPGGLQTMGSLRVRHDWATSLSLFTFMHWRRKWQPTPVFLPGESQGRRSLVGCCLCGHTESDVIEAT